MDPNQTHELEIKFKKNITPIADVKEQVIGWLNLNGEHSFVEGQLDDLDIDHEFVDNKYDFYGSLGGNLSPITIYSYDKEHLNRLHDGLAASFGEIICLSHGAMDTEVWKEGWKESFKPISTKKFYIHPPWEKASAQAEMLNLLIDPGMAFGTGQHATTQVCLEMIETLDFATFNPPIRSVLDIGTGSGILAIACKRLGIQTLHACDIDPNSIIAAKANALANDVEFEVRHGSLPFPKSNATQTPKFDLCIANILFVVLEQIIEEIVEASNSQGLIILSGLLVEQKKEMLEKTKSLGLTLVNELDRSGWSCLMLKRNI